jgi:hypothetical protein
MIAKSRRMLALLDDPRQKNRFLEALSKDTMEAAASLGSGEIAILKGMESLDPEHEQYLQDLKGEAGRS